MSANTSIHEDAESRENQPVVYRRFLLRVVFWALGLAAGFGAVGVLFAGHETLWRIVGTCAATAVGAFLILIASRQLDRESTWLAGVMSISLFGAEYIGTLGLIWNLFQRADEPVGLTMLSLAATVIPAIVFSTLLKRADSGVSARAGITASGVVFVLLAWGTWASWYGQVQAERWGMVGGALAVFALLAVLCLIGYGTDRRHWRWLGVAAAALAFSISAYAILWDIHTTSAFFVCVVSVAAVVAHANAMAWCPLKPSQRWLLWGTIGAGIATAGFVDLARITSPWQEEMLGRLAGAAAILGGCGTLALLVLAKINQRGVPEVTDVAGLQRVVLTCPRCQLRQTIAIGSAPCTRCGLIIEVRLKDAGSEEARTVTRLGQEQEGNLRSR